MRDYRALAVREAPSGPANFRGRSRESPERKLRMRTRRRARTRKQRRSAAASRAAHTQHRPGVTDIIIHFNHIYI